MVGAVRYRLFRTALVTNFVKAHVAKNIFLVAPDFSVIGPMVSI